MFLSWDCIIKIKKNLQDFYFITANRLSLLSQSPPWPCLNTFNGTCIGPRFFRTTVLYFKILFFWKPLWSSWMRKQIRIQTHWPKLNPDQNYGISETNPDTEPELYANILMYVCTLYANSAIFVHHFPGRWEAMFEMNYCAWDCTKASCLLTINPQWWSRQSEPNKALGSLRKWLLGFWRKTEWQFREKQKNHLQNKFKISYASVRLSVRFHPHLYICMYSVFFCVWL